MCQYCYILTSLGVKLKLTSINIHNIIYNDIKLINEEKKQLKIEIYYKNSKTNQLTIKSIS